MRPQLVVGIDASNTRSGGAVNHLSNLLQSSQPDRHGIARVVVWTNQEIGAQLPSRSWLDVRLQPALEERLVRRLIWQQASLPALLKVANVDVLLSPGGTALRKSPVPQVTMFRNALPFEPRERRRYRLWTVLRYRLELLRLVQTASMRRADGLICLTDYAVSLLPQRLETPTVVIPHGVEDRFFVSPRPQLELSRYTWTSPFRLLYVSPIWSYKHQWNVATAVNQLRRKGVPVTIDFVGAPAEPRAVRRLMTSIDTFSEGGGFAQYHGPIQFEHLHRVYRKADGFVFASSCENLPNTLLEAMASGLPIASSKHLPMPEVLGDAGVYFDPESAADIEEALSTLLSDPVLRDCLARRARSRVQEFRWDTAADKTWGFVSETLKGSE